MRPYRWQDPPPPPVREIRWRREQFMRFNAEPETIALPVRDMSQPAAEFIEVDNSAAFAPSVPTMTIEGVEYVEKSMVVGCQGCEFINVDCTKVNDEAERVFGSRCDGLDGRRVIYIRKA